MINRKRKLKKLAILKFTIYMIFGLVVLFSVFTLLFSNPNKSNTFFGYRVYIVLSDSMNPEFKAGDIVITKSVKEEGLNIGDIITYRSIDPNTFNEIITHQIIDFTYYQEQKAYITKGMNNENIDIYPALEHHVLGRYTNKVSNAGFVFEFFRTPWGYAALIILPFLILSIFELRVLFIIYKTKKMEKFQKFEDEKTVLKKEIEELKTQKFVQELDEK
jgi:signal peptidase